MLTLAVGALASDFEVKDAVQFKKIFPPGAKVERLATDFQFIEGPAWMSGGFLVFSDIPANELKKWTPQGVSTFRSPSNSGFSARGASGATSNFATRNFGSNNGANFGSRNFSGVANGAIHSNSVNNDTTH